MLFDSTLRRELARNFGGTLVVILTIVLTIMFIRNLGQAALGRISPQDVMLLLAYIGLGHLSTMLALSLFIAVVATLSRMYRASEMTIWFASGVPLGRFVRPVLGMSWPVLLLIAVLSLFVWPWQNERSAVLKDQFERRSDLSRVAPGQFQTSADGERTFFFEGSAGDPATGRNVFTGVVSYASWTNTQIAQAIAQSFKQPVWIPYAIEVGGEIVKIFDPAIHHELPSEPESGAAAGPAHKVLVVDDDVRNIFAISSILERHGMNVITANNGQEAIDRVEQDTGVAMVLMDIMMPGMDGYETMRAIRERPKLRMLPIIALTAKAMKGDREKCIEAGASDYIAKPVHTDQLLALLRQWLHR